VAPDDAAATARNDQFLFGPDVLAAPVLGPGVRERDVQLPAGDWIDLWRSGAWDSAAGAFVLGGVTMHAGGQAVTVPAPLDELPLLVRAGAVLPLVPADVDTLAPYGDDDSSLVTLADRRDRLALLAFPRGETTARVFERSERVRSREVDAGWQLVVRGKRRRTWDLQASLATLQTPFTPCDVSWNGARLADDAWSWDATTQVIRATFTGRRGALLVRACDG